MRFDSDEIMHLVKVAYPNLPKRSQGTFPSQWKELNTETRKEEEEEEKGEEEKSLEFIAGIDRAFHSQSKMSCLSLVYLPVCLSVPGKLTNDVLPML